MPIQELPPELLDWIIDHLHDDKKALLAASTVCRSWLPSCRHHIFEELEVRCDSGFADLSHIVRQIGCYVQELCLSIVGLTIELSIFKNILSSLPNLKTLVLDQFLSIRIIGSITMPPTLKLDHLRIFYDVFSIHYLRGLALILQLFRTIDDLIIDVPNVRNIFWSRLIPPTPNSVFKN